MEQQAAAEAARRAAALARAAAGEEEAPQQEQNDVSIVEVPTSSGPNEAPQEDPRRQTHENRNQQTPSGTQDSKASDSKVRFSNQIEQPAPFPALYRVVKDEGAPVWNETHETVIRTVPFGVVVLCEGVNWKQEVGFVMKLPDGWVSEDTVVRVTTLHNLRNSMRDKQQQQQLQSQLVG
jgi:hypothetical protein